MLTTQEAAEQAGVSVRQLDHWTRYGIMKPRKRQEKGSGRHRRWDPADVPTMRVLGKLSTLGAGMWALAAASKALKGEIVAPGDKRWIVIPCVKERAHIVEPKELAALAMKYDGEMWAVSLATAAG